MQKGLHKARDDKPDSSGVGPMSGGGKGESTLKFRNQVNFGGGMPCRAVQEGDVVNETAAGTRDGGWESCENVRGAAGSREDAVRDDRARCAWARWREKHRVDAT
ncbi:hypothetical protein B0H14DRAFT_2559610 [Mycena olivaceomarginata]|nr:hypothetical protein B0H14DRAFT_2576543 [Mycena olivaceomarginata]KAJ7893627.1 hypothetical protein B0H14DRAFT_2559610 [Mycena olivaceomarginata]